MLRFRNRIFRKTVSGFLNRLCLAERSMRFQTTLNFQYSFPIHPLSGKQKPHQYIRHDAGISRPPVVILQACQNGGGCAIEDEEAAPDLCHAAGVAHAFGGKVGVLQSGEAFDDGLFGKQAAAENGEH